MNTSSITQGPATLGGFMRAALPASGAMAVAGPAIQRAATMPKELLDAQAAIARGEQIDLGNVVGALLGAVDGIARNVTSGMSNFPARENLEAEAKILTPTDTPMRNRIPRVPGAGLAASWYQITSLGGGWGSSYDQPGGGSAAQVFFAETGAPAELTSTYARKTASYKLMGVEGSVSGFAMASGATFQNQLATEKRNALLNFMLLEEHAILNGSSTSTSAPWGDGSNALAFDGLLNLVTTANGVPSAQVQTSVGTLSFAAIDSQLRAIWNQGGRDPWILLNQAQMQSIRDLASNASNGLYKIQASGGRNALNVGLNITGYIHPITGEVVPFIVDRFMPAGTMIFGCDKLADGRAALEMDVLPQVQLPELAPNESIQGYVVQDIPPSKTAPQVHFFLISLYEVLKMKGATVFAKSTGVS